MTTLDQRGFDRRFRWTLHALALGTALLWWGRAQAAAAPQQAPTEIWEGTLALPGGVGLPVVLRITREGNEVRAVMDSPDQGATGIAIDTVSSEEGALRFESKAVGCKYYGALSASRDEAVGTFAQAGANLPLTLRRTKEAREPRRPQTPKAPFPYRAEDVAYDNTAAKTTEANPTPHVRLAGTLLVPSGAGPFPAVLLITGSGPQDRDESLMGHKPFWVLADALARRGIAVLRVDDRGVGASTGDFSTATSADQRVWVPLCTTALIVAMVYQLCWHLAGMLAEDAWLVRFGRATLPILLWHFTVFFAINAALFALGLITKENLSDNWSFGTASRPGCSTKSRRFGCPSGSIAC